MKTLPKMQIIKLMIMLTLVSCGSSQNAQNVSTDTDANISGEIPVFVGNYTLIDQSCVLSAAQSFKITHDGTGYAITILSPGEGDRFVANVTFDDVEEGLRGDDEPSLVSMSMGCMMAFIADASFEAELEEASGLDVEIWDLVLVCSDTTSDTTDEDVCLAVYED